MKRLEEINYFARYIGCMADISKLNKIGSCVKGTEHQYEDCITYALSINSGIDSLNDEIPFNGSESLAEKTWIYIYLKDDRIFGIKIKKYETISYEDGTCNFYETEPKLEEVTAAGKILDHITYKGELKNDN